MVDFGELPSRVSSSRATRTRPDKLTTAIVYTSARRALERLLMTGQGFEKNRVISEVVTVERLITAKLGFDAPPIDRPLR